MLTELSSKAQKLSELMKSFAHARPLTQELKNDLTAIDGELGPHLAKHLQMPIRAISLVNEAALATAVQNDTSADCVFAQQVLGLGAKDDVLLAISTSGNSRNILLAVQVARVIGMKTIALTGPVRHVLTTPAHPVRSDVAPQATAMAFIGASCPAACSTAIP